MDTRAATIRERFGRFGATEEPPGILPRTPSLDLLTSPLETDAEQESIILEKERKEGAVESFGDGARGRPRKIGDERVRGGAGMNPAVRSRGLRPRDARLDV